ncbi:MAG TPA: DegT/DnrJ/EryC1/StrS family aminotransferase [Candidatus Sulfotelmatobacter sp.]|nr:DegT/DnrJ/EryC1/StrS family aminotransferase [Candidatus Sulfotelmatobacter sp.]
MNTPSTPPPSPSSGEKDSRSLAAKPQHAAPLDAVPILDLQRQYEQVRAEVLQAVGRVCASQHYVLGPEVEQFERELADFCGARDAVGCSSGTDALWLALAAAGVQPGDRVLTTPFSFFASASSIVRAGARPVFADIEPHTFNLDPAKVRELLHSDGQTKMRALLPVHLYGQCAAMDSFQQLADEFHLTVIEDAAQAIGAAWIDATQIDATQIGATRIDATQNARRAGSLGAAAAFSFYPTKNLSAYGEAGLVTTSNPEMAAHMRRLRNHGSSRRYLHEEIGWNSRLDAMQAAILRVKLKYVEGWNQARRERAVTYDRLLVEAGLARMTQATTPAPRTGQSAPPAPRTSQSTISNQQSTIGSTIASAPDDFPIHLPHAAPRAHHVFHQYVIRAYRRDDLREFLTARKIGTEIYYPIPLHLQPCFAYLGHREGDFPEAERAAKEVVALPMFPELTEEEQRWVVQSIADFYC